MTILNPGDIPLEAILFTLVVGVVGFVAGLIYMKVASWILGKVQGFRGSKVQGSTQNPEPRTQNLKFEDRPLGIEYDDGWESETYWGDV